MVLQQKPGGISSPSEGRQIPGTFFRIFALANCVGRQRVQWKVDFVSGIAKRYAR